MYPPSLLDTDILSELLTGLKAKKADRQIFIFNKFIALNNVLPITDDVIETASDIYAYLKLEGNLISDADIFVAAITISNSLVLITNNTKHFSRIKNLSLNNWKM